VNSTRGRGARGDTSARDIRPQFRTKRVRSTEAERVARFSARPHDARVEPMGDAVGAKRLVPLMGGLGAIEPLLFDVGDVTVRLELAVAAGDTPARERCESEESNEGHDGRHICKRHARSVWRRQMIARVNKRRFCGAAPSRWPCLCSGCHASRVNCSRPNGSGRQALGSTHLRRASTNVISQHALCYYPAPFGVAINRMGVRFEQ